jgi:hypothetical protein
MIGNVGRLGSYGLTMPGGGTFNVGSSAAAGTSGGGGGGGGGGGAAGIAGAVVGGVLNLSTAIIGFAGQNKALNAQFLLADQQATASALSGKSGEKQAKLALKAALANADATKAAAAAQMSAADAGARGSAATATVVVSSILGVLALGVGGYAVYKKMRRK